MNKLKLLVLFLVLLLGLYLRLHNYTTYPQRGATSDEYSYSFMGVSLLTKGIPISWSAFPEYGKVKHLTINGIYFPIVSPYFDHPPLNGLVVGSFAILNGQTTFEKIELKTIRIVPIFLTLISSIFIFLLGKSLYNYKTGIWALLIYSTTTIFVIQSRVVLAENLVTPLLLGSIYLFYKKQKKINFKIAIILGIIAGMSFWAKELGIVTFFSVLFLMIYEKIKAKNIVAFTFTSLIIVCGYLLYGALYNWDIFVKIMSAQSGRVVGPQTLLYLLSTPIIINKIYYDGWYFLGFTSMFVTFLYFKENRILLIPSAIYFLLLLFSLTEKGEMGWYLIPLFPFFSIFTAKILEEQSKKIGTGFLLLIIFVGMYYVEYGFRTNFGLSTAQFRIIFFIFFSPLLLSILFEKKKLYTFIANSLFYMFIFLNFILTFNYIHPA